MPQPTTLQSRLAGQIISHARLSGWQAGHHLTEDSLLPVLGTSRTPIRAAMAWLETSGVLEKRPNRGFFLKQLPAADHATAAGDDGNGKDKTYLSIARDRLARSLPDAISENELMRRYDVSRAQLHLVLARIAAEGWIERRPGRGWAFLPLIDTLDAYQENHRFRQLLELGAMRAPEFRVDPVKLAQLEQQQRTVRDSGYRTMTQAELFEVNARFHETLAEMGRNRFLVQALVRANQLRRLMEYDLQQDRNRLQRVCSEHLAIIAALQSGDIAGAATRLDSHLNSAAAEKSAVQTGKAP
ncbi:MAG: GntR family transcriptional regulator [Beijerinckiaceae bacterium]